MSTENFGMMNEEAYFVSRLKLINWINDLLELEIKNIEDCATGAIYCQVVDSVFCNQNIVSMKKLDFSAKYSHEFVKNYKMLQEAFKKVGLSKTVPVERLIRCKYQDNLEFLQWLYQWYQRNTGTEGAIEYDAYNRRCLAKGGKSYKYNKSANFDNTKVVENTKKQKRSIKKPFQQQQTQQQSKNAMQKLKETEKEKQNLETQISNLTTIAKEIEEERDFYFQKAYQIENLCLGRNQSGSINPFSVGSSAEKLSKQILDVLYKSNKENAVDQSNLNNMNENNKMGENDKIEKNDKMVEKKKPKSFAESVTKMDKDLGIENSLIGDYSMKDEF
ncbi:microtubule integrity protein mal3 [Bonamia ostreae]|uniref:Microtubule integrity protein mal3 n=1 Tax=Bonamia ostreae TaxID=126728 RepID=A0ABV2AK30_9EUKA